jgi:palmitoyltransferase
VNVENKIFLDSNYIELPAALNSSNSIIKPTNQTRNVCRKCIFPKPARAHHCSICARCILNQDHHCPWINNCVGHLNHRYFFQFCFFLTIGSFYASTLGFTEYQHYLFGQKIFSYLDLLLGRRINDVEVLPSVTNPSTSYTFLFLFIVAITACLVLMGFTLWHFYLISYAETTIEFHINSMERKRMKEFKQKFINPYHLGFIMNWKMFLGLNHWREIFYKNLLPSSHRPFCDGINWPMRNLSKSFEETRKLIIHTV